MCVPFKNEVFSCAGGIVMVLTVDLPLFTQLGFSCRCYTVQLQLFFMSLYILSAFAG